MALTVTQAMLVIDKVTAMFNAQVGTVGSGYGTGDSSQTYANDWGMDLKGIDLTNMVGTFNDYTLQVTNGLYAGAKSLSTNAPMQTQCKSFFGTFLTTLDGAAAASGVSGAVDLASFALAENNGTVAWNSCLFPPDFRTLFNICKGSFPTQLNCYAPAIANMGTFTVGGAFSAGTTVDTTKYAGVAVSRVQVTTTLTGSGVVTVTGVNQNGTTGRTWTATLPSAAPNGTTYRLTPANTGDILTQVTGISCAAGITAGAVQVVGAEPDLLANMGQLVVSGSVFTAGTTLLWGSPSSSLVVTGFTGSTATCTVTGVDQNGVGNRQWTASVTGNGEFSLTPGTAGTRIQDVVSMAVGGTMTAGTIVVASRRVNPPT